MDIENVTTTPLVKKEVKLYKIRWIIGFVLFINGFLVMFVWHFFGVINEILAKYFQVSEETVDWLTMSAAVGTCGSGPIVGFIFVRKPTAVKAWYVVTIFVMIAAFSIFAIVIYIGKYLNLCILAQVVVGVVTAVFFSLLPLTSTVWFAENEQATVLGIGWFSMMVAVLAASAVPPLMFSANGEIQEEMFHLALLLLSMAVFSTVFLIFVCVCMPNSPEIPPSHSEMQRLAIAKKWHNENWTTTLRRFAKEAKFVITDRTSITIVVLFCLVDAIFVIEYMLAPASADSSQYVNGTIHMNSQQISRNRGLVLTVYSAGGLVGCIGMGVLADKIKSYNPLANIIGISLLVSASSSMIGYEYRIKSLEYIGNFIYGLTTLAFYPFIQKMFVEHVYPTVQESTQGFFVVMVSSVLLVVGPYLIRRAMQYFGDAAYYAIIVTTFFIVELLILSIKPTMRRTIYENRAIAASASVEQGDLGAITDESQIKK